MEGVSSLAGCGIFLLALLSLAIIPAVMVAGIWWLGRSNSASATTLRRRLGFRRFRTAYSGPAFIWGDGTTERLAAARAFATKRGFEFVGSDPLLLPRLSRYGILYASSNGECEDVVRWQDERHSFSLCSYSYLLGGSDTTRSTILLVEGPELRLPAFLVRGRTWLQQRFHSDRWIDIDEDGEFVSRYRLDGEDAEGVRDLFNNSVRQELKSVENCAIESRGEGLLFLTDREGIFLEDREEFVDESLRLLRVIEESAQRQRRWR